MLAEPEVVHRPDQPYVAIRAFVSMESLGTVLPPLHPEVRRWLSAKGVEAAGDPFFKYNVIDMDRQLEVEVGLPVGALVLGDDRVLAGVLPGGKYATLQYAGHPAGLLQATRVLLDWAAESGLTWDVTETAEGERWGARLEIYGTEEPDMDKWQTQLAFRLAAD